MSTRNEKNLTTHSKVAGGWTTRRDRVFSSSSYLFSFHLDNGTLERERECPFGTGVDEEEEAPFFIIRNRKEEEEIGSLRSE